MAGRRRHRPNDIRINIDHAPSHPRAQQARAASILRPSEQLRRHRYGSELPQSSAGRPNSYAYNHTADLYANLLELREQSVKTPEVEPETAYEHLSDHLQDVLEAGQMLRQLPMSMNEKRKLLRLCKRFEVRNINALSAIDSWKFHWFQFKVAVKRRWAALTSFSLFSPVIRSVERSHGSGVASYFLFLRSLLGLNVFFFLLMLGFVILPQDRVGSGIEIPQSAKNGSRLSLLFDGKGYLFEYSVLFYGFYDNQTIGNSSPGYNLPLAYIMTTGAILTLSFIILSWQLLGQNNVVVHTTRRNMPFSWLSLASWDFNISDLKSSKDRTEIITDKFKKAIKQSELSELRSKWRVKLIRAFVHILVFLLLVGSVCAIYFTVDSARCILLTSQDLDLTRFLEKGIDGISEFFSVMRVPLVVSSLNIVMPFFFEAISQWNWERRHPRAYLKLTLARSFILYGANFVVLLVSLFIQMTSDLTMGGQEDISCCLKAVKSQVQDGDAIVNDNNCCKMLALGVSNSISNHTTCCYNYLRSSHPDVVQQFSCLAAIGPRGLPTSRRCWETLIGQELFKLLCIDILLEIAVSIFITEFLRGVFVKTGGCTCCRTLAKKLQLATFSTSQNALNLVYQQSLAWFGTLFCPFLFCIAAVGNLIVLLLRAAMCHWFIRPRHVFRDFRGSARNYHVLALIAMLLINLFAVGYIIVELEPSSSCGPFRTLPSMGSVILQEIGGWATWLQSVLSYLRSAAVVCILLLLLCALAYYQWCQATAYKEFQKDLVFQMKVLRSKLGTAGSQFGNSPTAGNTLRTTGLSRVALTTPDGDVRTVTLPRVIPTIPEPEPPPLPLSRSRRGKKLKNKKKAEDKSSLLAGDVDNFNDVFEDLYGAGQAPTRMPFSTSRLGVPLPGLHAPPMHARERTTAHINVPDRFVGTDDDPLHEEEMPEDFFRNPLRESSF